MKFGNEGSGWPGQLVVRVREGLVPRAQEAVAKAGVRRFEKVVCGLLLVAFDHPDNKLPGLPEI